MRGPRFLARAWPWFLLAVAALFFAARYMPAVFLSMVNADEVSSAVLYHDLVDLHHSPSGWQWNGSSLVFPDMALFFLLNFLLRDGLLAMETFRALFFVGWIAVFMGLYAVLKGRPPLSFVAAVVLFFAAAEANFGRNEMVEFLPRSHSGASLMTIAGLILLLAATLRQSRTASALLLPLVFLTAASDFLFFPLFVAPGLGTLGLLALTFPDHRRAALPPALAILLGGVAAYLFAPALSPLPVATGAYTHLQLAYVGASLSSLADSLRMPRNGFLDFLCALDLAALLVLGALLLFFRRRLAPTTLALLAFSAFLILFPWAATILTGNFKELDSTHYVVLPLAVPVVLLAFVVYEKIRWARWSEAAFAIAAAGVTAALACFPPAPSGDYDEAKAVLPFLENLMRERHIQDGLSEYWHANLFTFFSRDAVPLRSLTMSGDVFHWINNLDWYEHGLTSPGLPKFRLIYLPGLDPDALRLRYGAPDEIVRTPLNDEVWLYSDARSIRYSAPFHLLSNALLDGGLTLRLPASGLLARIGQVEGTSRTALEGRDHEGYLTYGPYLTLSPGHYRVTFRYAYLAAPAPDKPATCDCVGSLESQPLASAALPCPGPGDQALTRPITVTLPGQQFELRVYYHGSGSLRVDSVSITCLDAPAKDR